MSKKRLNVFIQDLKDTTTVLQQLEACIKACKDVINSVDTIEQSVEDLNIDDAESLLNTLSDTVAGIINELPNKQDKLIAGDNIEINGNVISGTVMGYTAGDNIDITDGVISATDTTYTAGENISIDDGVISATDTTYSAGSGININSNTISVDTDIIASKNYVDNKANLALYEYELEFVDGTMEESWYYRFYSAVPNIAIPTNLNEVKQLVENYGINVSFKKSLLGYSEINAILNFSKCYVSSNKLYVTRPSTATDLEVTTINYISLAKREC